MKKIKTGLLFTTTLLTIMGVSGQTRTEKDLLGEKQIPANAYYGVQTARALENFKVSGVATNFYPDYVRAYAMVGRTKKLIKFQFSQTDVNKGN